MTRSETPDSVAVAVVLARAGSKGVPGKNMAIVGGRPCLAWTIEHALAAVAVDRVLVSSDCATMLDLAASMGVEAVRRSGELAGDAARVDDAARAALVGRERSEAVVILYANVPVRPRGLIDRGVRLLVETGCDSVQSYSDVGKFHPWWQVRVDPETGRVSPWTGPPGSPGDEASGGGRLFNGVYRRQDLPPAYVPDGGVVVVRWESLFAPIDDGPHGFLGRDHRAVVQESGAVVDIDSPVDLAVADARLLQDQRI